MTKQEQIEEMAKIVDEMYNVYTTTADDIAEGLYNAGYRKVDDFEAEDERLREVIRQLNTDYNRAWERLKSDCREIGELKAENEQLKEKLNARLTCDFVKTAQTHAVQDFAEKIKEKYSLYDDRHILYRIIDELLKEYE